MVILLISELEGSNLHCESSYFLAYTELFSVKNLHQWVVDKLTQTNKISGLTLFFKFKLKFFMRIEKLWLRIKSYSNMSFCYWLSRCLRASACMIYSLFSVQPGLQSEFHREFTAYVISYILFKYNLITSKAITFSQPTYLSFLIKTSSLTRGNRLSLSSACPRKAIGRHGLQWLPPTEWNRLPQWVRSQHTITSFWSRLKTYLFRLAYPPPWYLSSLVGANLDHDLTWPRTLPFRPQAH